MENRSLDVFLLYFWRTDPRFYCTVLCLEYSKELSELLWWKHSSIIFFSPACEAKSGTHNGLGKERKVRFNFRINAKVSSQASQKNTLLLVLMSFNRFKVSVNCEYAYRVFYCIVQMLSLHLSIGIRCTYREG